jgi:hypothetical protein
VAELNNNSIPEMLVELTRSNVRKQPERVS